MLFEKKLKREETKEFNLKLTRTERDKHGQAQKSDQMCFAVAWRREGITKAHLKVRKVKRRNWQRGKRRPAKFASFMLRMVMQIYMSGFLSRSVFN